MAIKNNSALLMDNAPPVLTAEQERELFYRLEQQRDEVVQLEAIRNRTHSESVRLGFAKKRYNQTRDELIMANMALVLSVANRFNTHNVDYDDMIAAGLDKLFYCVDRFDVRRGYKFSTYAVRSLWRLFAHLNRAERKHQDNRIDCDPYDIDRRTAAEDQENEDALLDLKTAMASNAAELSVMEKSVLEMRFGLDGKGGMTLKEVGEQYGLTKERVRQIQRGALVKLKEVLEE